MKLVIDIPSVTYDEVQWRGLYLCPRDENALVNSIKNGTPYEERPYGEWVPIKNRNGTVVALRCSACGQSPKYAIKSDFCPRCGSDNRKRKRNDKFM